MLQSKCEIKQSKKIVISACISIGVLELFFAGLVTYFIYDYVTQKDVTFDEKADFYTSVCSGMLYAIILAVAFIYILHTYIHQVDIYCENKMIRQMGNKVIFELKYDNIAAIRQGIDSLFLVLKEPILKTNGKKGPRNFYEHYSKSDIRRIKQLITNSNYNIVD